MIHKRLDIKPLNRDKLFASVLQVKREEQQHVQEQLRKSQSSLISATAPAEGEDVAGNVPSGELNGAPNGITNNKKKSQLNEAIELSRHLEFNTTNTTIVTDATGDARNEEIGTQKVETEHAIIIEPSSQAAVNQFQLSTKLRQTNPAGADIDTTTKSNTKYIQFRPVSEEDIRNIESKRLYWKYSGRGAIVSSKAAANAESHVASCACETCQQKAKDAAKIRTFKIVGNSKLIQNILEFHELKKVGSNNNNSGGECNLLWSNQHLRSNVFKTMKKFQKINLFPRSFECTRKDSLATNLNAMVETHGKRHFGFVPECYVWPRERDAVIRAIEKGMSKKQAWILKPAGSSQGRGVFIITRISQLPSEGAGANHDDNWVVERYINNPLLFDGKKFDLRLYVCVTSFHPLRIYIHEEGLVRLATEPYTNDNYSESFVHLTNYAINKKNENYIASQKQRHNDNGNGNDDSSVENEGNESYRRPAKQNSFHDDVDSVLNNLGHKRPLLHSTHHDTHKNVANTNKNSKIGRGIITEESMATTVAPQANKNSDLLEVKWPLSKFNSRMKKLGANLDEVWADIHDIIIKTLISVESKIMTAMEMFVAYPDNLFELFGFDILIDDKMKPWLMEVNFSPSMNTDSPLDYTVKSNVVVDLLNLVGVHNEMVGPMPGVPTVEMDPMTLAIKKLRQKQRKALQAIEAGVPLTGRSVTAFDKTYHILRSGRASGKDQSGDEYGTAKQDDDDNVIISGRISSGRKVTIAQQKMQQMGAAYNIEVITTSSPEQLPQQQSQLPPHPQTQTQPQQAQSQQKSQKKSGKNNTTTPRTTTPRTTTPTPVTSDPTTVTTTTAANSTKVVRIASDDGAEEPAKLARVPSAESRFSVANSSAQNTGSGPPSTPSKRASKGVQAFVVDAESRRKSMMRFEGRDTLRPRYDYAKPNNFRDTYKHQQFMKVVGQVAKETVENVLVIAVAALLDDVEGDLLNTEPSVFWQHENFIECRHLKSRFPLANIHKHKTAINNSKGRGKDNNNNKTSSLIAEEKQMLVRTVQELMRSNSGGFNMIFPSANCHTYFQFFEQERELNVVLAKYFFSLSIVNSNNNNSSHPQQLDVASNAGGESKMADSLMAQHQYSDDRMHQDGFSTQLNPTTASPTSATLPGIDSKDKNLGTGRPSSAQPKARSTLTLDDNPLCPHIPDPAQSYPFVYLDSAPADPLAYSFDLQFDWQSTLRVPYATTVLGYAGSPIPIQQIHQQQVQMSKRGLRKRPSSAAPVLRKSNDGGEMLLKPIRGEARVQFTDPKPRCVSAGPKRPTVDPNVNVTSTGVPSISSEHVSDYLIQSPNDKLSPRNRVVIKVHTPTANAVGESANKAVTEVDISYGNQEPNLDLTMLDSAVINRKWAKALGQSVR
jgi:hypothetical protein